MSGNNRRSFLSLLSFAPLAALFSFGRKTSAEGVERNEQYRELNNEEAALDDAGSSFAPLKPVDHRWAGAYDSKTCASLWVDGSRACFGLYGRMFGRRKKNDQSGCDLAFCADAEGRTFFQVRGEDGQLIIIDLQKIAPLLKQLETKTPLMAEDCPMDPIEGRVEKE